MNQSQGANGFSWSELMESSANLWLSAAQSWQELTASLAGCFQAEEYMQASLSMWKALFSPWTGMQYSEAKGPQPSLDMIQAFFQVMGARGISQEISKWLWNKRMVTGRGFENFQHETVKAWTEIYEKGIQPLLRVPQVGFRRVFQEKINRLADNFNTYQATVSEFQMLLSVPMEKSFADMREELDKLGEKGEPQGDYRVYYGMWIKVLENHYMSLFRSDEYRLALYRLLDETAALRITGNDVLTELLEFLPVPTNKEMDDLYKEIYTLKKQTREATKKIGRLESALAKRDVQ